MAGNALAATVYTNRAEFEAALLSSTVEDFETYMPGDFTVNPFVDPDPYKTAQPPNGLPTLTLSYFSLDATPNAIKLLSEPHSGSHNTTSKNTTEGGQNFLYLDTDNPGNVITGSTTLISLEEPVDAFGFDYTGVFEPDTDLIDSIFTVTIELDNFNSFTFDLLLNEPEQDSRFWGISGLGSFSKITLTTSLDSGYGVDDVTFGAAVPIPPAIWLFGSGLLALAGGVRRRKTLS